MKSHLKFHLTNQVLLAEELSTVNDYANVSCEVLIQIFVNCISHFAENTIFVPQTVLTRK